jgi:arginase family enzyme
MVALMMVMLAMAVAPAFAQTITASGDVFFTMPLGGNHSMMLGSDHPMMMGGDHTMVMPMG